MTSTEYDQGIAHLMEVIESNIVVDATEILELVTRIECYESDFDPVTRILPILIG